jgi:hypothetical protein
MDFYLEKYPDGSAFLSYKSLLYFEDADKQVMPKMLIPETWANMKKQITAEVKKL